MSDIFSEASRTQRALTRLIHSVVRDMPDFKSAFRVYKAKVVTAPNGTTCGVQLIGETTTINIPYSSACASVAVGDFVLVGSIFNSLSNAVVWQKIDFS